MGFLKYFLHFTSVIKQDFFIVLLYGKQEIQFLKRNVIEGKIDGSTYHGLCACLSGTLVNRAKNTNGLKELEVIKRILKSRDSIRPAERFFLGITVGDTPANNQLSWLVLKWIEEFELLIL